MYYYAYYDYWYAHYAYYYAYIAYYSRLPNQLLKTRDGIRDLFGTAWGPSPGNPRSPVGARVLNDKDRCPPVRLCRARPSPP